MTAHDLYAAGLDLAANPPNNNSNGQEFGSASPIALVVLIALLIAVAFLIRSMSRHLKKVPATFDPDELEALDKANAPAEPNDPADDALDPANTAPKGPKPEPKAESKPKSGSATEAK